MTIRRTTEPLPSWRRLQPHTFGALPLDTLAPGDMLWDQHDGWREGINIAASEMWLEFIDEFPFEGGTKFLHDFIVALNHPSLMYTNKTVILMAEPTILDGWHVLRCMWSYDDRTLGHARLRIWNEPDEAST